jgi:hypothetical protein
LKSGGIYILDIEEQYKERVYDWAKLGTDNSSVGNFHLLGLKATIKHFENTKHLLILEHNIILFNFSFPMKLLLLGLFWKIRKGYTISTASTIDLINYMEVNVWDKKTY